MKVELKTTGKGVLAYIRKSIKIKDSLTKKEKVVTKTIESLGYLHKIAETHGCADPEQWVRDRAVMLAEMEKDENSPIRTEIPTDKDRTTANRIKCGELALWDLYYKLKFPLILKGLQKKYRHRAKYDLNAIVRDLIMARIIFPASKSRTFRLLHENFINKPLYDLCNVYDALNFIADHSIEIQAELFKSSKKIINRDTKCTYYDCTNYYTSISFPDADVVDENGVVGKEGLRKVGLSKEHSINPIVQEGLLMDRLGIPVAMIVFPGNKSELDSMKPLEESVEKHFGIELEIISTDAGLASEENRRYNMIGTREYICTQSIPSLSKENQETALNPTGWRILWQDPEIGPVDPENPEMDIFDLSKLSHKQKLQRVFYKDIEVTKYLSVKEGSKIVEKLPRTERMIVTFRQEYADFLQKKRQILVAKAAKNAGKKKASTKVNKQNYHRYLRETYKTRDGKNAAEYTAEVDAEQIERDARFDGFYGYGTSLGDDVADVIGVRKKHNEIEHLNKLSKSFLETRPLYLSDDGRIEGHILVCFMSLLERIADVLKVPSWIFLDDKLTVDDLVRINMNGHHNAQSLLGSATLYEGNSGSAASASVEESTETSPSCTGPTTNTDSSAMLEAKEALIKNLTAQVEDLRRDKYRLEKEIDRLRAKYEPD